jgi:hypothetical protein
MTTRGFRAAALGATLLLTLSRDARGQTRDPRPAWTLTGAVVTYRVSDVNGWGIGPSVGAQRRLDRRLRLDLTVAALLSSSGFYNFTGLTLDAGPAVAITEGPLDTTLGAGVSAVVGGDSDGTGGGWVGAHVAGQGTAWLGTRLGLSLRGAVRLLSTGRTSPSVAAGLALRF